jgi:hypothetical protein
MPFTCASAVLSEEISSLTAYREVFNCEMLSWKLKGKRGKYKRRFLRVTSVAKKGNSGESQNKA